MQKKLPLRIAASLILSVMLFVLPIGAFIGSNATAASVLAEESTSASKGSGDGTETGESGETGGGAGGTTAETETAAETEATSETETTTEAETTTETETTPDPKPECICESRCGKYEYDRNCPVCSADYEKCAYKMPSVKITITVPPGWHMGGSSVKVRFSVEDILNTGNLAVKSVKAKVGQNGSYQDVSEDMCMEISENCSVYVLVTDAKDRNYERSRAVRCFDTVKPTLNAAVSDGLLTIQAADNDSGVKTVYVNGYEFTDVTNGTLNIRLSQFDAGYEYFAISAMDAAGNMSDIYKTKNPYYKDPQSDDDGNPAEQLPSSAEPTKPSSATADVTEHTKTDSNGNTTSSTSAREKKQAESAKTDGEAGSPDAESGDGGTMNLGKEFYTIEAASGKVFYLIIDRDGEEEKAYFLTEIRENDLLNVTTDNSETLPKNSAAVESQNPVTDGALPNNNAGLGAGAHGAVSGKEQAETADNPDAAGQGEAGTDEAATEASGDAVPPKPDTGSPLAGYGIMGILGAAVIGAAYYFKVARKKQDGDFVEDEEDEDDDNDDDDTSEETDGESDFFGTDGDEDIEPDEGDAAETIGDGEDGFGKK